MIEKVIKEIERRMFSMMDDKLEIVTEFNNKTLILTTASYFDGECISEHEFDLEPMVDEIVERAVRACKR
jgi:hypothetical protein